MPNEPAPVSSDAVAIPPDADEKMPMPISMAREISGPLPSSMEFAGYEQTLPGSAERILAIWEREADNRHENEKTVIKESLRLRSRGQIFGFVTILLCAGLILASILLKQPFIAIPSALVALAGIATVFFGKR